MFLGVIVMSPIIINDFPRHFRIGFFFFFKFKSLLDLSWEALIKLSVEAILFMLFCKFLSFSKWHQ